MPRKPAGVLRAEDKTANQIGGIYRPYERDPSCSSPDLVRYATTSLAARVAAIHTAIQGVTRHVRPCPCGWWHITTQPVHGTLRVDRDGNVHRRRTKTTAA